MIKKLVYGLAIIAGLVSCNDDYTDWASPQSNDSKEPVDKIAFMVEPAVSAIDFCSGNGGKYSVIYYQSARWAGK